MTSHKAKFHKQPDGGRCGKLVFGTGVGHGICAVDALISLNHIVRKSDWKSPVGAGPLAMPEALRISGKHLQSPAFRFARRTSTELPGHDVIRPVRLRRSQHLDAN